MIFRRRNKKAILSACLALVLSWASPLLACGDESPHVIDQTKTSKHLHSVADINPHDHGETEGFTPQEICEEVCDQMYSPAPALAGDLVKSEKEFHKSVLVSLPELPCPRALGRADPSCFYWPSGQPLYLTTERLRL